MPGCGSGGVVWSWVSPRSRQSCRCRADNPLIAPVQFSRATSHIQQVDTPQRLYDDPANMFVAAFIGAPQMNMLPVTIARRGEDFVAVFEGRDLSLPARFDRAKLAVFEGRDLILGLRPENFHETIPLDVHPDSLHQIAVVVDLAEPMGSEVHLNMTIASRPATAKVSPRCKAQAGDGITLIADLSTAHLFDPKTERSILH
jgi:multiple sugar transport system ATP-binding protein